MFTRNWTEQLRTSARRETPEQERDFLRLVDAVNGKVTRPVAKVLVATFTDTPDYGTQERVASVLASAPTIIRVSVILEEMPRLVAQAPEWAEALLSELLEHDLATVRSFLRTAPVEVKSAVRAVAVRPEFREFQRAAEDVV
jgi:uncharacterized protein (DUF849 family)